MDSENVSDDGSDEGLEDGFGESLANPHDRFARWVLSRPENVRDIIQWQLPKNVLKEIDLDSLEQMSSSFVSRNLLESISDLAYEVDLRNQKYGSAIVAFLFEHKSYPDKMTCFQVLRYIVETGDQRLRNDLSLCCVIPIVLYHGPRQWNVARSLREIIDVPEALQAYIPDFSMPLIDLSFYGDEEIQGNSIFFATMLLLKYAMREELPERLEQIFDLLAKVHPPATAMEAFEAVLRYIVNANEHVSPDRLKRALQSSLKEQGESLVSTIAQQWFQEGIEKGIEKGREEGIEEGIEKGREEGELVGQIRTLQRILKLPVVSRQDLTSLGIEDLRKLAAELTAKLDE